MTIQMIIYIVKLLYKCLYTLSNDYTNVYMQSQMTIQKTICIVYRCEESIVGNYFMNVRSLVLESGVKKMSDSNITRHFIILMCIVSEGLIDQ